MSEATERGSSGVTNAGASPGKRGIQATGSGRRSGPALAALALGAFTIGTSELLVVGILPLVARGMRVSVGTAGLLVTSYALGISLGGPLVTAATIRLGRRMLLWLSLAAYIGGNLLALAAAEFGVLIAARAVTGAVHGLFIGVASMVAASLVPPGQRGRAMSMVFGGIAVSTVVGLPLGTLVGQALGWRAAFAGVVILGVVSLAVSLAFVPAVASGGRVQLSAQARFAFAPRVLAMLGFGLLVMGGQFTAFTYLTPFLERVTGVGGGAVSAFLLAFGIAAAAGTFGGGRLADRSASTTLAVANAVLIVALGVLYAAGSVPAVAVIALAAWGLAGFGLVPALQLRVIALAGPGGDLAATLGASAVNAGIALGALAGGLAVAAGGTRTAVVVALACCAVALPAGWATRFLTVPQEAADSQAAGSAVPAGSEVRTGSEAPAGRCCAAEAAAVNCRVTGRIQYHVPGHVVHDHPLPAS